MTRRRALPEAPDGLWDRPDMAEALAGRDMAAVLTIYQRWTGATQPQIANAAGVGQPSVSAIMSGKRKVTSLDMFERFADGLDIPRRRLGLADREPLSPAESSESVAVVPEFRPARPSTVEDGVRVLSGLWRADLDQNETLTSSAVEPGVWNEAALDWLLHSADPATRVPASGRRSVSTT